MEKYTYRIWDKKSDINSRSAEKWLELNPHLRLSDVFIVSEDGIDKFVESINVFKIDNESNEEIINRYIENLISMYK